MRWLLAGVLCAVIGGCASTYENAVTVKRISNDVALIKAQGNAFTNRAQTDRFALLRAAEETLAAGYAYFEVVDMQSAYTRARPSRAAAEQSAQYGELRTRDRIETSQSAPTRSAAAAYQPVTQFQIRMYRDYPDHPDVRHFYAAGDIVEKYDRKLKFK